MSATPLLSVFMPTYNGAAFVREALESVIDNGFSDLEIVVVDDASVDDTVSVVESIRHPALRLVRQPENLGVALTRQRSIALLRGRHVALLDQDDIAVVGRFERQVARLEAADGPDIIGGAIERFGDDDRTGVTTYPQSDAAIKSMLLFSSPIINPAVCMKLAPFREGRIDYSPETGPGADYALWADAMRAGLRLENLAMVVTRYRRHAKSYTAVDYESVVTHMHEIRAHVAASYFPSLSGRESTALADALSSRIVSRQGWTDSVRALARAAALAPAIPGIDVDDMMGRLARQLIRFIRRGLKAGAADYDTLEVVTESDRYLEQWRARDSGALDKQIMALFA